MDKEKLIDLAARYLDGKATEAEKEELHSWYDDWLDGTQHVDSARPDSTEASGQRIFERLRRQLREEPHWSNEETRQPGDQTKSGRRPQRRVAVLTLRRRQMAGIAAALVLSIGLGIYLRYATHRPPVIATQDPQVREFKNDVAPGGNKAVLTLANGATILLDSASNGQLAQQGKVKVIKLANGQLIYQPDGAAEGKAATGKAAYNTMSVPRGGQYKLTLPDGTNVWLNAESSITYPTFFTGAKRRVTITGEAYFEVAKNPTMPFVVGYNEMEVQVLGTHFNIDAYPDDPLIRTTLLEGSVKLHKGSNEVLISPGQQAGIGGEGRFKVSNVDVEEVVAWKNGYFHFTYADIESIMHQLARWYDIDVSYEGKIAADRFTGEVPRSAHLSEILQVLESSGARFRINGRKIVVLP